MTDLPRHSVSVTGIVFRDDGRVLAIQRRRPALGSAGRSPSSWTSSRPTA